MLESYAQRVLSLSQNIESGPDRACAQVKKARLEIQTTYNNLRGSLEIHNNSSLFIRNLYRDAIMASCGYDIDACQTPDSCGSLYIQNGVLGAISQLATLSLEVYLI